MVDAAFVLSMMVDGQPEAPWRETYPRTASAIARAANDRPLPFRGNAEEKTAALLVSTAIFESALKPDALGDYVNGKPTSFCLLQVSASNFRALRVASAAEVLEDVDRCVDVGLRMMHVSFAVCAREAPERRMDHYAAGGDGCRRPRHNEGEHRLRKAFALLRGQKAKSPQSPGKGFGGFCRIDPTDLADEGQERRRQQRSPWL